MSLKLKGGKKLSRGMRRIAGRQMDEVISLLSKRGAAVNGESVHLARKGLKQLRAELRLVRLGVAKKFFRRENKTFRAAGRDLSPARDAEVLIKTLEKLRGDENEAGTDNGMFAKLETDLHRQSRAAANQLPRKRSHCAGELRRERDEVDDWPLDELKWKDICRGIERCYKRGRKAFKNARATRAPEHLHEWRKRAKDLWYQLCLLEPLKPRAMKRRAEEMKELGAHLGDDHDLVMLEAAAREANLQGDEMKLLSELVFCRRERLQEAAFELGARLYVEKPAEFGRRIVRYAKKWKQD